MPEVLAGYTIRKLLWKAVRAFSFLGLTYLSLGPSWVQAQCSLTGSTMIPDNDVITLGFNVSGLTDANLASPTQGICGIDLVFNHEYIVDLTITLISPFGTSVTLIGPAAPAGFPTGLSTWNIHFTSCGLPAMPDAGFNDTWSNLDPWQILTTYTGTYYPSSGCLEDFNFGPANGNWILVIQDHELNETGTLLGATIHFCNPAGLQCSDCIANAGILSPPSIVRCAGDRIQSSEVTVNFGNNIPSASIFEYQFILLSGNVILQSGSAFSSTLPAGMYALCGLSYKITDAPVVNALLAAGDYNALQQAIINKTICGQLSTSCIPITMLAPPDTVKVATNLCQGEMFIYGGQQYTTSGTFYQSHDGPGMCDTIIEIRIAPRTLNVVIPDPDTLFCNGNQVMLESTVSGASGPFNYLWTTTFGNITTSPTQAIITVDQAGPYMLSVTDGICNGIASVNVVASQGFPQVFVEGGTLTCNQTSLTLSPVYIPSNGLVNWSGPNGFSSNQPVVTVTQPGLYIFRVTNSHGCSTSKSVEVAIDTTTTAIGIYALPKDCPGQQDQLGVATGIPIVDYTWTGPNNFTGNNYSVIVTDAGVYSVTGTFANGCQSSDTFDFDGDFAIPDIIVPGSDTLNCGEIISLTANSSVPGVNFYWNWPGGFIDYQQTTMIQQEGTYFAVVNAPNGCFNSAPVDIVSGPDVFPYQVYTDTLTCKNDSARIGVITAVGDLFHWLNYAGPEADQSSIQVGTPGTYTVMITDTNSMCVLKASIAVVGNFTVPDFGYILDTVSCLHPQAHLSFMPYGGVTYTNVYWELPDLTLVPGPNLFSSQPGDNHLYAVGANGCIGVKTISIPFDTLSPFLLTESDTLICNDTVRILAHSLDPVLAFQWNGPGLLNVNGDTATVDKAGLYTITATGINGCATHQLILVDSNYTKPDFTLIAESLRCDRQATLLALTTDSIIQYQWYNAAGQVIGIDSSIQVNTPGPYSVALKGLNRCIANDTIDLQPPVFPNISIQADTLTCSIQTVTLQSTVDFPPAGYAWIDQNLDTIGHAATQDVMNRGPFQLAVTGQNGCITRDTIQVPYDTLRPVADINLIGEVRCQFKDVMFDGTASIPANIAYQWSTQGGTINGSNTIPIISAHDTGYYSLIITRLDNGCQDSTAYHLLPSPDAIAGTLISVIRPKCNGDSNGSVSIDAVQGGIGPFLYQLNGGAPQPQTLFDGLQAGSFNLTVEDALGCQYDTTLVIPSTPVFTVDAGSEIEIYLGETAMLSGTTDLADAEIQGQAWDSLGTTLCTSCPEFGVSPLETTTYSFQVTSVTGCVAEDQVTVIVVAKGKYFIANIFSPNGDNINDEVRINPGPGIRKILQWVIFDRWGNAVYGKTDFDPGDPSVFWNGRATTGDFVNPGVFPYLLEIELINGEKALLHGDITVVR